MEQNVTRISTSLPPVYNNPRLIYIRIYTKRDSSGERIFWDCPECGHGNLQYNPNQQRLTCDFCSQYYNKSYEYPEEPNMIYKDPDNPNNPINIAEAELKAGMRLKQVHKLVSWLKEQWNKVSSTISTIHM